MSVIQNIPGTIIYQVPSCVPSHRELPISAPVMLERLETIDVIALDAAVAFGFMGERAQRLLANRKRIAPYHLPLLLITAHNDAEQQQAYEEVERLQPL